MDDPKQRGWGWWAWVMAAGMVIPILYVLSFPPAVLLVAQGVVSIDVISAFYYPLGVACRLCPPFGDALVWYTEMWGVALNR